MPLNGGQFPKAWRHQVAMPEGIHIPISLVAPILAFSIGLGSATPGLTSGKLPSCFAISPLISVPCKEGEGTSYLPAPDVALIEGLIALLNHKGSHSHTDAPDWPVFLQHAQNYIKTSSSKSN